MPRPALSSFSPALTRRLARTPLRRSKPCTLLPLTTPIARSYASNTPKPTSRPSLFAQYLQLGGQELPSAAALNALLSRLSLPPNPKLHDDVLSCLTHPSFNPERPDDVPAALKSDIPNNELFNALGNSLLGMFASEYLAQKFPLLPTETLKMALTAYVGPAACVAVAREIGISVTGAADAGVIGAGVGSKSAGIPIRWERTNKRVVLDAVPVGSRYKRQGVQVTRTVASQAEDVEAEEGLEVDEAVTGDRLTHEMVVAQTMRALVGLVYQEAGIHATRDFVTAHFLSRHLDLSSLFSFRRPKQVLFNLVQRHLADAGVDPHSGAGRIESRVLAETGRNTSIPLFNIGLFLPSGLKISEGFGTSFKMAEHRAATNGLMSLFLVRGDQQRPIGSSIPASNGALPSSAHVDFPLDAIGVVRAETEEYRGVGFGGLETKEESSRQAVWGGRRRGAKNVIRT